MANFLLSDWIDVEALKAQSRHVSAIVGALISFALVGYIAKKLVPTDWEGYIDYVEGWLLLGLFAFFAVRLFWDLAKRKGGKGSISSAFVVA